MTNKKIRGFKLLFLLLFKNPKKLTNGKLEALLRARVHAIEKQGNIEETTDFLSMIWSRQLYHEAKKREILSLEELEWCDNVLFGKKIKNEIRELSTSHQAQLLDIIKERRSIRSWQEGKLTKEEFELLVNAAKWAPSSSHRQPWHFLLTNDRDKIKMLSEFRDQKFVNGAPNCILALINLETYNSEEVNYTPYLDAGAAIQNLLLMAHSMGFGACWVNFGKMEVPDDKMERIKNIFGIPNDFIIVSIIPIGKLNGKIPTAPGRKKTTDITHMGVF